MQRNRIMLESDTSHKQELEDTYKEICSATDKNRAEIYQRFSDISRKNYNNLGRFLKSIKLNNDACIFEIYEALSEECDVFAELFDSELERLLILAQNEPNNRYIYTAIDAYSFISDSNNKYLVNQILQKFKSSSNSQHAQIRRISVWMLGEFSDETDNDIINILSNKLSYDPDWQVRFMASECLKDIDSNNLKYKLSMKDKFRVFLSGGNAYDYTGSSWNESTDINVNPVLNLFYYFLVFSGLLIGVILYLLFDLPGKMVWPAAVGFTLTLLLPYTFALIRRRTFKLAWKEVICYSAAFDNNPERMQKKIFVIWISLIILVDLIAAYELLL